MAHPEPEGVTSLPGLLEWFREQDECRFHGGVEIAEFEYQGRGMRATSDVTAGTALFCCPLRMLLSAPRYNCALPYIVFSCTRPERG
jgi:hypothetical protein